MFRRTLATLLLLTSGVLTAFLHHILPEKLEETVTGAIVRGFCSGVEVHPEVITGIGITLFALAYFAFPNRIFLIISGSLSIFGLIAGILMKPLSFYLRKEPLIIGFDTAALNSHAYIRESILVLSALSLVINLYLFYHHPRVVPLRAGNFAFSIANISRRRFRSLAIVIFLSVMVASLLVFSAIWSGIGSGIAQASSKISPEIVAVPAGTKEAFVENYLQGKPYPAYIPAEVEDKIRGIPGVYSTEPMLFFKPLSYYNPLYFLSPKEQPKFIPLNVVAISERDTFVTPWIYHSVPVEGIGIIVGWRVKYYPGQEIRAGKDVFTVAARLEETGNPFLDNNVFIKMEDAKKLMQESIIMENIDNPISAVFVRVRNPAEISRVAEAIDELPEVDAIVISELSGVSRKEAENILFILAISLVFLWISGFLMISLIFILIINERAKEIGILQALGASKGYIFREIFTEGVVLGVLGSSLGLLLGGTFLVFFQNFIENTLWTSFSWRSAGELLKIAVISIIPGIVLPVLASALPAYRNIRREPAEHLKGN